MTITRKLPAFNLAGQVPASPKFRPGRGITIATDAAVNRELARAGSSYIASSGLFGLAAHPQPPEIVGGSTATVAELRAIWRAVSAAGETVGGAEKITVLTDSQTALRYLRDWQQGRMPSFPAGYQLRQQRASGNKSSLEKLAQVMLEDGSRYVIAKVTGHAGDHLNEAADSLAKLALRTGTRNGVTSPEAQSIAVAIVTARLSDYWNVRK